jgi:hypothetical protein
MLLTAWNPRRHRSQLWDMTDGRPGPFGPAQGGVANLTVF